MPISKFRTQLDEAYKLAFSAYSANMVLMKNLLDAEINVRNLPFINLDLKTIKLLREHIPIFAKKQIIATIDNLLGKINTYHPMQPVLIATQNLLLDKFTILQNKAAYKEIIRNYKPVERMSHIQIQQTFIDELKEMSCRLHGLDKARLDTLGDYHRTRLLISRVSDQDQVRDFISHTNDICQKIYEQQLKEINNLDSYLEINDEEFNVMIQSINNSLELLRAFQKTKEQDELIEQLHKKAASLAELLKIKLSLFSFKSETGQKTSVSERLFAKHSYCFIKHFIADKSQVDVLKKKYQKIVKANDRSVYEAPDTPCLN